MFYMKTIMRAALVLAFLFAVGCASSNVQNNSRSSGQFSSSTSAQWFQGGTLHNATVAQWKSGTYQNKLATSSDWLAATKWKGALNTPSDFDKVKVQAQNLVTAINGVVTVENTDSLNIAEIAAAIILASNEFGA